MHSFQPSRGRILFEVFCALVVVSSMVGAWRQTNASALLVAAAAAGLWAMVRLLDLGRRQPLSAKEPQPIASEPEAHAHGEVDLAAEISSSSVDLSPATDVGIAEREVTEPAPRARASRRKGGSRTGNGRRGSAKALEIAVPALSDELETAELSLPDDPDIDQPEAALEPAHIPHAPLFEPEPFVRMQRQAFGRRGRL